MSLFSIFKSKKTKSSVKLSEWEELLNAVVYKSIADRYIVQGVRGGERYISLSEELTELG